MTLDRDIPTESAPHEGEVEDEHELGRIYIGDNA
jgi:hypothetical protein